MTSLMTPSRRATRLLRYYPKSWRDRYGDEFVDFMEQSIVDQPHNTRRTSNIILKSFKARLGELGLLGSTMESATAPKAALSTSTVLAAVFTVFALFYWSCAMVAWNSNPHVATTLAVSIGTAAITVSTMLLSLTLLLLSVVLIWHALRSALSKHDKRVVWPLVLILGSTTVIVNSMHQYLRFTIARGGIEWTHVGVALKQVAGATQWVTQRTIWGPSWTGWHIFTAQGLLNVGTPVAVLVLALSMAKLIRLSEVSAFATRAGRWATTSLALGMLFFLVSFAGWELAGGFNNSWMARFTQMQKSLFVVIAFIALLGLVTSWKARSHHESIEIIKLNRESS
jgi:hypothetical protein